MNIIILCAFYIYDKNLHLNVLSNLYIVNNRDYF